MIALASRAYWTRLVGVRFRKSRGRNVENVWFVPTVLFFC
jgi:hypothetical protein